MVRASFVVFALVCAALVECGSSRRGRRVGGEPLLYPYPVEGEFVLPGQKQKACT